MHHAFSNVSFQDLSCANHPLTFYFRIFFVLITHLLTFSFSIFVVLIAHPLTFCFRSFFVLVTRLLTFSIRIHNIFFSVRKSIFFRFERCSSVFLLRASLFLSASASHLFNVFNGNSVNRAVEL